MSDMKTVTLPIASNPSFDAIQIVMLDSSKVSTHTVGASLSSHVCHPSTDYVMVQVFGAEGILIGNGDAPTDDQMLHFRPGDHPYGLPEGLKTVRWKAVGADTVVKIQEVH